MVLIAIAAHEEAMASFGIEYSFAMAIVIQFSIVTQLMVVLITLGMPGWHGQSLQSGFKLYLGDLPPGILEPL